MNASVSKSELTDLINTSKRPIVIDFYADWCGPCKRQSPVFKEVEAASTGNAVFVKVDIDENVDLATTYGVMSIPTIMILDNGHIAFRHTGLMSKSEIENAIKGVCTHAHA
jgi:thioredoxin 1